MKYLFYPGCSYSSSAGYKESTNAVCKKLNIELIEIPDWNCCGATVMHGNDEFKSTLLVSRIIALGQKEGFSEIVTGCNACYTTLKKISKKLNENSSLLDEVNKILSTEDLIIQNKITIRHLCDVIINDIPEEVWTEKVTQDYKNVRIASYYGCQFTRPWMDIDDPERPEILENFFKLLGFTPVNHSAKTLCCGASHTIPLGKECSPLISRILKGIKDKKAEIVTTICPLCQFNLDSGQKNSEELPVTFFTQLTGLALGINPKQLGLNKLITPLNKIIR